MTKIAFVFPGQGAQSVGMMTVWGDYQTLVKETYAQASDALGYDLWQLVSEGPEERLNQTEITQPAMLCAGVACWKIATQQSEIPNASLMAGHSFGEYSALVCAQSLDLESAVKLVAKRGILMQSAVATGAGSMAVILGLDDIAVIEACAKVQEGIVEATNFNAPGQVAISGHKASVDAALVNAKTMGAKRTLPLAVSVPSHSSLMQDAAEELFEVFNSINFSMPIIPIIHNQNAGIAQSVDEIKQLLRKQLYQPVRWADGVREMHTRGIECLVECGPGKVLSGLTRRIEKTMHAQAVFDTASLENTIQYFSEY
ncbi:MAG: ACP S-malonyltransferase [Proteobacteria bacterium]|nr:ACP S-malonyltransferase [Pseudomonadota bacterium]